MNLLILKIVFIYYCNRMIPDDFTVYKYCIKDQYALF